MINILDISAYLADIFKVLPCSEAQFQKALSAEVHSIHAKSLVLDHFYNLISPIWMLELFMKQNKYNDYVLIKPVPYNDY